jgi:hypothetical protein
LSAKDFYGVQHFFVWQRRDTHLECDAGDAAENFIHVKNLFRDRFGVADQQRAGRSAQGVKQSACGGWPGRLRLYCVIPFFVLGKRRVVDRLELDRYVEGRNAMAKTEMQVGNE